MQGNTVYEFSGRTKMYSYKIRAQVCAPKELKMKKENRISLVTMLIGFLIFLISSLIQNQIAKAVLSLIGISVIVISIVYEKKAKNPKNFGILQTIRLIIPKSKNKKSKRSGKRKRLKKMERRPALLIIVLWLLYNVFGTEVFRVCRLVF